MRNSKILFSCSDSIFSTNFSIDLKEYIKQSVMESHLDLFVARYAVLTENERQALVFD